MFHRVLSMLAMVVLVGFMDGHAQVDGNRQGLWLSFGGGGGWMDGERCASSYFRMGGTPNSQLHFGGQVLHWWHDEDIQHSNVAAAFALYPFNRNPRLRSQFSGWFVKAGFGLAVSHDRGIDQAGMGLNLGTGIDLHFVRSFCVTPNLDLLIDLFNESTITSVLFTLGLSWH